MNKGCFAEKGEEIYGFDKPIFKPEYCQDPTEKLVVELHEELREIRQELHEVRIALVNLGRWIDDGK